MLMFPEQYSFIMEYINEHFLEAVEKFEEIVVCSAEETVKATYLQAFNGNVQNIKGKRIRDLAQGYNQLMQINVNVLRLLKNKNLIFLFIRQNQPKQSNQSTKNHQNIKIVLQTPPIFYCVIIQSINGNQFSGKAFINLAKQLTTSINLQIRDPYMEMELVNQLIVIRAPPQNIIIQNKNNNWHRDMDQVKKIGNQVFRTGKFLQAYVLYQFALSCCHEIQEGLKRSILYSNSSACFYKMNLYDACIKYSTIAIKINSSYEKSYIRKINALLQKKNFHEIPVLLMGLQKKKGNSYMEDMNKKYSIYLANSLGMYNWFEIFRANIDEIGVAFYHSKKIGLRKERDRYAYYALEDIQSYQFLILSKPMVMLKKSIFEGVQNIVETVSKCSQMQRSFGSLIKALPFGRHPDNGPFNKVKSSEQFLQKLKCALIKPKSFSAAMGSEPDYLALWPDLFKFMHRCKANSSWVVIQSLFCVSSVEVIKKGQTITLDYIYGYPIDRKRAILSQKFWINCKCEYCEPLPAPDYPPSRQRLQKIQQIPDVEHRKIAIWNIIEKAISKNTIPSNQIIKIYVDTINASLSWKDLLNLTKIIYNRTQQPKSHKKTQNPHKIPELTRNTSLNCQKSNDSTQKKNKKERNLLAESIIVQGLSTFLKIPKKEAYAILDGFL